MRRVLSVILSLLLIVTLPLSGAAAAIDAPERAPLQVGVVSDIHYFAQKMTGNWCDAFMQYAANTSKEHYQTPALVESALAALAAHAEENGMRYVLLPGDLTANGEYDAHAELAARLERFEQETGMSVIVTNGNHDVNNFNGITFESGSKQAARPTTPEDFREIYKNLGFDLAYHTFTPKNGRAGMLSYSVRLDGGYRLIVLDVNKYSADVTEKGTDEKETGGAITEELMAWALAEIEDAKACGEAVIGMEHHGIVEHFQIQTSIFQLFLVDNWQERAETFADAGLSYMLTGHMHDTSITDWVSDSGNVLYDISTGTLSGFPNTFREIRFDNADGLTADVQTYDVDCILPVTVRGETYAQPYRQTYSFGQTFKDGLADLAMSFLGVKLDELFDAIQTEGSLIAALKTLYHLDLEEIISRRINVRLGPLEIFSTRNVMSFLNDLDKQLRAKVLTSRSDTEALVRELIDKLVSFQVSDLPCTKYIDTYGFGDPNRPGTLQDAAYSALVILYSGNQSIDDDPFMQDVLDFFRNRDGGKQLFDLLHNVLLDDLVEDCVLEQLQFNIDTLFPPRTLGHVLMKIVDKILSIVFRGDKSYANILNSVLRWGLYKGIRNVRGLADYFLYKYLPKSRVETLGTTIANMIEDIVTDHGDGEDLTRHLTDEPRTPEATCENYRLPTNVSVTAGPDAATSRNIIWYTKFSVTGSDIEIVPYSEDPSFSGTPTTNGVRGTSERHDVSYHGVDLGTFGFMDTEEPLMRHTVQVTGLSRGAKYSYRIGDAGRGWWSEPYVLDMNDSPSQAEEDVVLIRAQEEGGFMDTDLGGEKIPVVHVDGSGSGSSGSGSSTTSSSGSGTSTTSGSGSGSAGTSGSASGGSGTGSSTTGISGSGSAATGSSGTGSSGTGGSVTSSFGSGNSITRRYGTSGSGSDSSDTDSSGTDGSGTGSSGTGGSGLITFGPIGSGSGNSDSGSSGSGSYSSGGSGTGSSGTGGRYGTGQSIPRLGGGTPILTMGVLFGAILVGVWARTRKDEDEE